MMDTIDIIVRLLAFIAILGLAFLTIRRSPLFAPLAKADEAWKEPAPEWSELPWRPRTFALARAMNIRSLARQIYFHSRGTPGYVKCFRLANGRERWLAWLEAPTYEEAGAVERAEWSTCAGALRLLLRNVIEHGGVWQRRRTGETA